MVNTAHARRPAGSEFGPLLQDWRRRRRLSQLALASTAGVSTRHLSFVETGRAKASREMVLHLAEHLDVPLRERNRLLLAAGFAPTFRESTLNAPGMQTVQHALAQLLRAHEPYPALVMNRHFELVSANRSVAILTEGVAEHLLAPPMNIMRAGLHPEGLARRVINPGEYSRHLLGSLARAMHNAPDDTLTELFREISTYPVADEHAADGPTDVVLPMRLRGYRPGDGELALFSTVATFGTPLDITVSELAIESFFPADPHTEAVLRARHAELPTES
ncbi:MAG TPA: helix-turn-helix transcriptional regulator [Sporichthyaceae bacterium]